MIIEATVPPTMQLPKVQVQKIDFEDMRQLSQKDKAYYREDEKLRPFYKYPVTLEAFAEVLKDKEKEAINREILVEVLREQYANLDTNNRVGERIALLADKRTFTVITAHQPSLFTGPLYYIYKIISAINLAEQLNAQYADYHFVPMFVTGGEDHDFEEMNHANIFGKTLLWENEESGSVGMMKTDKIQPVLDELREILGSSPYAEEVFSIMQKAHRNNATYGAAAVELAHELFKQYGLVVLNMNTAKLKREFIPLIKEEIFQQPSKAYVEEASAALEAAGFSGQAFPRAINFFYLNHQIRERIVEENGLFKVLNTDLQFSREEMENEIDNHPERFSPNVIMRPLYQEKVLPNLAYIGGGGEIAYWLERKEQFAHFGVNFPMLIRRNSALWIDKSSQKKLNKLDLTITDLLEETEALIKRYVRENASEELSLKAQKKELSALFNGIAERTKKVDASLVKTVKAEMANQLKSLSGLESRLLKAEKQRQEISINQIRNLQEKLFPNGLQERHDNFMQFYVKHGRAYLEVLKQHLQPLEKGFVVLVE